MISKQLIPSHLNLSHNMTSKSSQKSGSHASGGYQYSMSLGVKQKKVHFIKQFFKILKKGFRSKWDRLKREAYLIRLKRPTLNDHNDSKKF